MNSPKPKVFIGSSSEGLDVARALQFQLADAAEVVLWNEGVFALSQGYLETLISSVKQFDCGIFVLRSDDALVSRGTESRTTRGNVLFELGLFYGNLGQSRTFAVYDSSSRPGVISDLHGISFAPYDGSRPNDLASAVGPACYLIRQELSKLGLRADRICDVDLKSVIDCSEMPIYLTDCNMVVQHCNDRLLSFLGAKRSQIIGNHVNVVVERFADLVPEERRGAFLERQAQVVDSAERSPFASVSEVVDLSKRISAVEHRMFRVWIHADVVSARDTAKEIGWLVYYHPVEVKKSDSGQLVLVEQDE